MNFSPSQQILHDFTEQAQTATWTTRNKTLENMEDLHARMDPASQDAIVLGFTLAKIYDDLGDTERAFTLLEKSNRHHQKNKTDTIEDARLTSALVRQLFAEQQATPLPGSGKQRQIFIVGMPRSGTSLVEQILASHSQVFGGGELPLLGQWCFGYLKLYQQYGKAAALDNYLQQLHDHYFRGIAELTTRPIVTDKMPVNFFWLGFVFAALPDAIVIHTQRDAMATCWSNFKTPFAGRSNGYACDLTHIGEFYRIYHSLMDYWETLYPNRIYTLNYEALTEDQETETRRLLEHCDLPFEQACLEFYRNERQVSTASKHQVTKPIYQGSSESWRKYEKFLGPLQKELQGIA